MSRMVGKHLRTIQQQRQVLDDWTAYEYDITEYWRKRALIEVPLVGVGVPNMAYIFPFDQHVQRYEQNLDVSERRLKTAIKLGAVVDITGTPLAHDICLVIQPRHADQRLGSQQRVRDSLAQLDFYSRFGRMVDINVTKLTVQSLPAPDPNDTPEEMSRKFLGPAYETVVLLSFEDRADAMLYRLALA